MKIIKFSETGVLNLRALYTLNKGYNVCVCVEEEGI